MNWADHFSGHAADYARHRPTYPDALFAHLAAAAPGRAAALDCGTGNGQAALQLRHYFDTVVAVDASVAQITRRGRASGVGFVAALADALPLADAAFDLVTVAQAVHWFDLPRFYGEVERVARPGGVVAVWCYGLMFTDPAVDAAVLRLYHDVVGPFWPPERELIEGRYADLPFPFEPLAAPAFEMVQDWSLSELVGYLRTWSAVQRCAVARAGDPLDAVREELTAGWGATATRTIRWPLHLRVGRVGSGRRRQGAQRGS